MKGRPCWKQKAGRAVHYLLCTYFLLALGHLSLIYFFNDITVVYSIPNRTESNSR